MKNKKILLMQVREATGEKIDNPDTVHKLMKEEAKADRECVWVLHLNTRNKIIEKELVSMGSLNHSLIHAREIFKKAIVLGANSIIVVHNHPSGNTTPSNDDNLVMDSLKQAGELLRIPMIDFMIISKNGYFSMKE